MLVRIVRFRSRLTDDAVLRLYRERSDRYRQVPGLLHKYYLRYTETGEHGAVYVWESEAALRRFNESDLGRSIGPAYEVEGPPAGETAEVVLDLAGVPTPVR